MKKGSAWRKNNRREIKKSFERYLAIIVIITLGVGFFAGLRITKDAMTTTLNSYVTTYKLHDFQLISTLGLVDEDVTYFAGLPEVEAAEGAISADVLVKVSAGGNGSDTGLVNASDNVEGTGEGDGASGALASIAENFVSEGGSQNGASNGSSSELVIKAFSLTDKVNQVDLQAGRMPQAADEVVVDAKLFSEKDLGKRLLVAADNDEETLDLLAYDAYTIVGLANSVNYINIDRGTTLIGDGVVNAFAYMPLDGFDADYFTEIYLDVNPAGAIYTDAYREQIDQTEGLVEDALQERADLRYQSIVDEAEEELAKGQADYDEALAEYETEKADALAKLEDARLELEDAKKTLEENEQELRDGEAKLADGEAEYQKGLADYEKGLATFEASKADTLAQLDASERKLADGEAQVAAGLRAIEDSGVLEQYEDLKASLPQLEAGKEQLAAAKAEAEAKFAAAEEALQAGEAELEAQGQTLAASREQLEALKLLPDADLEALAEQEAVLAAAEAQYEEGKAALLAQRETFEQEKEAGMSSKRRRASWRRADGNSWRGGLKQNASWRLRRRIWQPGRQSWTQRGRPWTSRPPRLPRGAPP